MSFIVYINSSVSAYIDFSRWHIDQQLTFTSSLNPSLMPQFLRISWGELLGEISPHHLHIVFEHIQRWQHEKFTQNIFDFSANANIHTFIKSFTYASISPDLMGWVFGWDLTSSPPHCFSVNTNHKIWHNEKIILSHKNTFPLMITINYTINAMGSLSGARSVELIGNHNNNNLGTFQ